MPHYYFDLETSGLNPNLDTILTIQYQKISLDSGTPEEPLKILKSWETSNGEEEILSQIKPLLMSSNPFQFVPVGNNLNFEFGFLTAKINKYFGLDIDTGYFHSRPHIDLKPIMILLNGGKFKGYHLMLNKSGNGVSVPVWFENKEYDKIIEYVINESQAFTNFYTNVHHLMFSDNFRKMIFNSNRRLDEFV